MMKLASGIVVVLVVLVRPAVAERATVFPLSASALPKQLQGVPDKLTRAVADSIKAEIASVPIEDAAGLATCDVETTKCLETVAKSVNATRLVFGSVSAADGAVKVTLTRFDIGPERVQRTFVLAGTPDGMSAQLVLAAASLLGREPAKPEPMAVPTPAPAATPAPIAPPPSPVPDPIAPPDPVAPPPSDDRGGPTLATWVLAGGGVAIAGIGGGLLVSARGLATDVERAPMNTVEDFERLTALEDKGQARNRMGIALVATGGVIATIGIVRAIVQSGRSPRDRSAYRIAPVPTDGGMAIVFEVGVP
jgi:hypothetical protein